MKAKGLILIIEDSPDITESVRLTLMKEQYSVVSMGAGQPGLMMAHELHPDSVVLAKNAVVDFPLLSLVAWPRS